MTVIKIPWRGGDTMLQIADWLEGNAGGPTCALRCGGIRGPGWMTYNCSEMRMPRDGPNPLPYLITKVEIDDPEIAVMFAMRWL